MKVIGITGGTGAGKTVLLEHLHARGCAILNCDEIYYELLRENQALRLHLRDAFGDVFLPDGALDRKALAAQVFGSPEKLQLLNTIVYYFMGLELRERLKRLREQGARLAAIDAVNLIESGLGELCDTTVAVIAPEDVRLARIMERDRLEREAALRRIRAQKDEEYYRRHCRILLENRGTTAELLEAADKALEKFYVN